MSCEILYDHTKHSAVLICNTSDWAFGPVFTGDVEHDADERAGAFLRWLNTTDEWPRFDKALVGGRRDARLLTEEGLQAAFSAWLAQEAAQWAREDAAEFGDDEEDTHGDVLR